MRRISTVIGLTATLATLAATGAHADVTAATDVACAYGESAEADFSSGATTTWEAYGSGIDSNGTWFDSVVHYTWAVHNGRYTITAEGNPKYAIRRITVTDSQHAAVRREGGARCFGASTQSLVPPLPSDNGVAVPIPVPRPTSVGG